MKLSKVTGTNNEANSHIRLRRSRSVEPACNTHDGSLRGIRVEPIAAGNRDRGTHRDSLHWGRGDFGNRDLPREHRPGSLSAREPLRHRHSRTTVVVGHSSTVPQRLFLQ